MPFSRARRLDALPPYLFIEIDRRKRAAIAAGKDIINLGVGDPDRPTHGFIIDALAQAAADPRHHRYPYDNGVPEFKERVAAWFERRFGVTLDREREILSLIGSKEGIGHLPLAVLNPGDLALVPQPGYPVYESGTIFAGGQPFFLPLRESRGWLPDFDAVPADVLDRAALLYLNYPNNPTGAVADLAFFERCVALARQHDFVICHDAAYSETYFDRPPPSILQVRGALDCCVEMHSLSKTFNMTGWRLGFAVGNAEVLAALAKIKGNLDSGQFGAIQQAGAVAIAGIDRPEVRAQVDEYRARRDALVGALARGGFRIAPPPATFYVFAGCPSGQESMGCAARLLEEAGVVAIPGTGFGAAGEGYVRFALCAPLERVREAGERIARIRW
ncbi:MAG: LL-diaminopimelate aminotransferase [Phycisphaerae bacterium]